MVRIDEVARWYALWLLEQVGEGRYTVADVQHAITEAEHLSATAEAVEAEELRRRGR